MCTTFKGFDHVWSKVRHLSCECFSQQLWTLEEGAQLNGSLPLGPRSSRKYVDKTECCAQVRPCLFHQFNPNDVLISKTPSERVGFFPTPQRDSFVIFIYLRHIKL